MRVPRCVNRRSTIHFYFNLITFENVLLLAFFRIEFSISSTSVSCGTWLDSQLNCSPSKQQRKLFSSYTTQKKSIRCTMYTCMREFSTVGSPSECKQFASTSYLIYEEINLINFKSSWLKLPANGKIKQKSEQNIQVQTCPALTSLCVKIIM